MKTILMSMCVVSVLLCSCGPSSRYLGVKSCADEISNEAYAANAKLSTANTLTAVLKMTNIQVKLDAEPANGSEKAATLVADARLLSPTQIINSTDISFVTAGYDPSWTAPSITADTLSDNDVVWFRLSDSACTNAKAPSITFFSIIGDTYWVRASEWNKVTVLSFAQAVNRQFIKTFISINPVFDKMSQCIQIEIGRNICIAPDLGTWRLPKSITIMIGSFECLSGYIGKLPNMSGMTNVTSIVNSFYGAYNATGTISDLSALVNLERMICAFYECNKISGNIDDIFSTTKVGLPKLCDSRSAFYNNYALSGHGMRFVNMPKSPSYTVGVGAGYSSYDTFHGCTNLADWADIPDEYK